MMAAAAIAAFPADAQTVGTADERAIERAADAFGIRIGVEQIGLYNETQVRGFNLQDTGNYRITDSYFAKLGGVINMVLSGVASTRVGYNALDADFPAPSGIVAYRLWSPFDASRMHAQIMLRDYGGRSYDFSLAQTSPDNRLAGLVGARAFLGESSSGLAPNITGSEP